MNIDEDENGDDGNTTSLKIHPVTGNIMVLGGIYDTYTYGVLYTIDQDTGRLLNVTEFKDSGADVNLSTLAYTNTGDYVIGGSKDGEFSAEYPVVPQTGSGTGTIVILRSAVPVDNINTNWQIGGTGITPFQSILYAERYTGLTGTTRQGTGATFNIINEGDGTYTVAAYDRGTDYLPGHKIKILGTDLPGPEITTTYTEGVDWTGANVQIGGTNQILVNSTETAIIAVLTTGTVLTNINNLGETLTITGPGVEDEGDLVYPTTGTTSISQGTSLGSFTIGNGIFTGATPDNDIIITVVTNHPINGMTVTHTGTAAGSSIQSANEVSGTNYEVGSGLTFTIQGPFFDNDYSNHDGSRTITATGTNYVNSDVIVVPGTSLGGTSPANDLTLDLFIDQFDFYINSVSGTSQTSTWKIETTAQVDFTGTGSWSVTYSRDNDCVLITPTWQRTFGTAKDKFDEIITLTVDSEDNIIAVDRKSVV
jgi:hypothetical protein